MAGTDGIIRIFAGSASKDFARHMCDYLGTQMGDCSTIMFSEGNTFVRINESIRDKDVYFVQTLGLDPNNEFAELLFFLDAFKRASANSVTAIIPYFSYAKGDKKDEPRVSIRARVCAECIELAGADRVITMDLHAAQVQGFFKKPVDHLYAEPLLCAYARQLGIVNDDLVVVSPDAGSAKRAHSMANTLGCTVAIGDKMRTGHDETAKVLEVIGEVKGKNCIVVDDFTISGGTLIDVAHALKDKGAKDVYAFLSHVVLREIGVQRIDASPIKLLVSTDTVNCPAAYASNKIKILSAAPMFAEAVHHIHDRIPMSHLFQNPSRHMLDKSFERQLTLRDIASCQTPVE
ncbi:MAG: ribose-phosphate diphosphokinase [Christensenellaceae bacterium]|jgi:ribose-phosphate pyrophosphokinase|nr:ribose-phosphate diphosphokinase [Christensenellaceae bacterium]